MSTKIECADHGYIKALSVKNVAEMVYARQVFSETGMPPSLHLASMYGDVVVIPDKGWIVFFDMGNSEPVYETMFADEFRNRFTPYEQLPEKMRDICDAHPRYDEWCDIKDRQFITKPEELTLLPCPACQSKTEFYSEYGRHGAGCHKCGIGTRAAYSTEERAAEVWNSLPRAMVWTTEPPKEAGQYYWALYQKLMVGAVQVVRIHGELHALIAGSKDQCPLSDFIQWAGPIPTPREPTE